MEAELRPQVMETLDTIETYKSCASCRTSRWKPACRRPARSPAQERRYKELKDER